MHRTNDKFQTEINGYKTFLDDQEELPRLSILDNYKQITRILTNQYIRSFNEEKIFGNRSTTETNETEDPEYLRFKEEKSNTMKMSTILKNLDSPKKKRKSIAALRQKKADELKLSKRSRTVTQFRTIL